MRQFLHQTGIIIAILVFTVLLTAGGFWWICTHDNGIAFLSAKSGAAWIVYPQPPDAIPHHAVPIGAVFRRAFTLDAPPVRAMLTVRAFKGATVVVNGQSPSHLAPANEDWKLPATADVTKILRTGTNEISVCVTNSLGPPALWLRLQTDRLSLGSDESWEVSVAGAEWQDARRAAQPPSIQPGNSLYGCERTLDSVARVWPAIAAFSVASIFLVLGAGHWLRQRGRQAASPATATSTKLTYGLFVIVVIARTALFINNLPQLPRTMGFDAEGHERYVQFIQEKHALPLPSDGWEMHQPPLYYAASALLLDGCGLSVPDNGATIMLRTVNGAVGLVHCWLALLCLRLLFPENPAAQAVGLLIAAFLPAHLYLTQYVTNEPLAGLLATAAFYFCLRALRAERPSLWLHVGIGVALGAAMLTKFSALLAIPVFLTVLALRLLRRKNYAARDWLCRVGLVLLSCLVVCGWHYGRVWADVGKIPMPNWETDPTFAWWQDPGFRTSTYYLGFGQTLVSPVFSGLHSFADGIYSTLWGDGLISGMAGLLFRPPWNYDLMNAEYLLAIVISFLLLVGFAVVLVRFIRQPTPEWLMVLGLVSVFGLGIVYLTLRGPWLAHVKAFYAFPVLVPFSALVAVGWNWLGQKYRVLRIALWVVVLVWAMTGYAAFWIRSSNPETYRVRGIQQAAQRNYAEAIESFSHVLRLNPDDADAHCCLANAFGSHNQAVEAVQHYREALRIRPAFPEALNNLAWLLATDKDPKNRDGAEAVSLAERACELTHHETTIPVGTLAAAYAEAGRFDDAIATAEKACAQASGRGERDLLQKNRELLELYRAHKPYHEAAGGL